jgi:RHS repeat-associated protein
MNLPENYRTLMVGYYTDSVYAMGIPVTPTLLDSNITYSGDTVKIAFTAPASSLRILLIANGPENGEGYYYLDDYSLREGWVTRMNCDPNNLADNPDGRKYRFGFNGMEADDETSDDGNAYTTFFRWYDSRLGRWKSVDPKSASSPFHSSYQAMSNNPLLMVDPLGDKEYKNMNSYTKETGLDKLGKYDWLRKDRIKRTSTWDNAMAHITRDKKSGELAPFAQVRDYYIWAHQKNQERGHESRWALGALYLVNDLADAYDEGLITTGTWFASNGLTDLLGELNMKIANYAITQFHRLLYGDLSHSPLKGVDAYNFDVNFVLQEQKEIALPVYLKYTGTNALNQLNSIFNGTGFLGFGSDFISIHMPSSMGMLNSNLLSKTDNFGVAARIHIPLFMLYPDTHKSGSLYGGSSQMDEIMKTGSSKGYNPMYASFRFVNQLIMRKKWK